MSINRKKSGVINKIVYYDNLIQYHTSPHQGVIPDLAELPAKWDISSNNIFNINNPGSVGVNNANPISTLDVSGSINASHNITINYISIAPPVGSIMAYTLATSPSGWLICNGTAVSRSGYSALFLAIGITFGNGDGDATFNVPNYQGAFLRGTGAVGSYSGPALNTSQNHATQTHSHNATSNVTDPQHAHTQTTYNDDYNGSNSEDQLTPAWAAPDATTQRTWSNINNASTGITVSTTVSNSTTSTDANETRPYNFGVYWIIKY